MNQVVDYIIAGQYKVEPEEPNRPKETEREHKVHEWDRLIGDRIDIRQEEDIRIGTWNIRKQATLGLESEELQAKIEIVMDYMRSMDIQIMALQETGRGKEQARAILPEGLTMTRLYMNGTLRSWIHYIEVRAEEGTQLEHRQIAQACAEAIYSIFPMDDII